MALINKVLEASGLPSDFSLPGIPKPDTLINQAELGNFRIRED